MRHQNTAGIFIDIRLRIKANIQTYWFPILIFLNLLRGDFMNAENSLSGQSFRSENVDSKTGNTNNKERLSAVLMIVLLVVLGAVILYIISPYLLDLTCGGKYYGVRLQDSAESRQFKRDHLFYKFDEQYSGITGEKTFTKLLNGYKTSEYYHINADGTVLRSENHFTLLDGFGISGIINKAKESGFGDPAGFGIAAEDVSRDEIIITRHDNKVTPVRKIEYVIKSQTGNFCYDNKYTDLRTGESLNNDVILREYYKL